MGSEHYCLKWNNHQSNLLGVFSQLLQDESLVDVTLACAEGHSIRAHKVVLSACSSYFQTLFIDHPNRHPIVILKDVCFAELKTLVDFMYKGEVNVEYCQLSALLKTAESLKVKGLAEMTNLNMTATSAAAAAASPAMAANVASNSSSSPPPPPLTPSVVPMAVSATAPSTKCEKEEKLTDEIEILPREKDSVNMEMSLAMETANKRLMNEDTRPPSAERITSPCPPRVKRSSRGHDCDDSGDSERDRLDLPDRNVKGGCPGPTDMSASGLALCQMPPSCSSPHVSEPFPGTSCLPPVQRVPLSLKKEVEWENKSAIGESSLDFKPPHLDSDRSDAESEEKCESLCGYSMGRRRDDCRPTTPFQLPLPPFGSLGDAGEISSRQNCSFLSFFHPRNFVPSSLVEEGGYLGGGGSGPHRCTICLAIFPSFWLLEQHNSLQHAINSRNSETGSPGRDKPFKCERCGQSYRYRSAYLKHQEQNHRAKLPAGKLFTCDVCGMQFRYLKSFKKHRLNHALEKLHPKPLREDLTMQSIRNNGAFDNCLQKAGESSGDSWRMEAQGPFLSSAALKVNGESRQSGRVTAPPSIFASKSSDHFLGSSDSETFPLVKVGERAASVPLSHLDRISLFNALSSYGRGRGPSEFPLHSRKINKSNRVSDSDEQEDAIDAQTANSPGNQESVRSQKDFPLFSLLRLDSTERQRENRFSCPFCSKCVRSKENLKLHIRKHTGERPFVCLFCGRAFGGKSDLTRHLRIHTGERPYHCEMCGKCFARADYLSKHLTTHVHTHNTRPSISAAIP